MLTSPRPSTFQKLEAELVSLEADVPRSQALAEKLTSELSRQEAELEAMLEAIKGEVEGYHMQLGEVRWDVGQGWVATDERRKGISVKGRLQQMNLPMGIGLS